MTYAEVRDIVRDAIQLEQNYSDQENARLRNEMRELTEKFYALTNYLNLIVRQDNNVRIEPFQPEAGGLCGSLVAPYNPAPFGRI